jgi:imidazolonepropionase
MNMACTLFRLTPAEALAGFHRQRRAALGLTGEIGRIAAGLRAELACGTWASRRNWPT